MKIKKFISIDAFQYTLSVLLRDVAMSNYLVWSTTESVYIFKEQVTAADWTLTAADTDEAPAPGMALVCRRRRGGGRDRGGAFFRGRARPGRPHDRGDRRGHGDRGFIQRAPGRRPGRAGQPLRRRRRQQPGAPRYGCRRRFYHCWVERRGLRRRRPRRGRLPRTGRPGHRPRGRTLRGRQPQPRAAKDRAIGRRAIAGRGGVSTPPPLFPPSPRCLHFPLVLRYHPSLARAVHASPV